MRCIFCLEERPESDEHVIPLALGGSLVTKRVCVDCNSYLGNKIDGPLINHPLMAILRHTHDLAGNSGTVPDALKLVLGSNAVLAGTDQRVRIENNKDGQYLARLVYHRQETTAPDGSTQVQVSIDGEDRGRLPEVISKRRRNPALC